MELRQRIFDALEHGDTTECTDVTVKYSGNPKSLIDCMNHLENVFRIGGRDGLQREEVQVHANDWFKSKQKRKVENG